MTHPWRTPDVVAKLLPTWPAILTAAVERVGMQCLQQGDELGVHTIDGQDPPQRIPVDTITGLGEVHIRLSKARSVLLARSSHRPQHKQCVRGAAPLVEAAL